MQWREQVSAREAEVLAAIRAHQSNVQIAARLHLSVRTVESHVSSLLRKSGAGDRRSLAALADSLEEGGGLPSFPSSFVGREAERDKVRGALRDARLVSLVGAGGMGKTRLAVVVAADVDPGAAFVDLVPVRTGGVARAVAQVLGVSERPPGTPADAVVDRLRTAPVLLVLDNCEHVVGEVAALVARVLRSCPRTTVLTTSRERLAVPGERLVLVSSLGPQAERLFLDRARAVDPDLRADPATVTRLCAALDGMPLAVELAAARAASLGVEGVQAALDDRLRLVSGGRGPDHRHHSLEAVFGWSLDLLDDEERSLFRRLGRFVGGFDLDAVAALAPELQVGAVADVLGRLVDRSLVVHQRDGTSPRWSLLATARAVAERELAASGEDLDGRYLRWAATTAVRLRKRIHELLPAELDAVAPDLQHALTLPAAGHDDTGTAYALASSLAHLSFARGHVVAARELHRTAADLALDPSAAAEHLRTAAAVALSVLDGEEGFALLLEAADLARRSGDVTARAVALGSAVVTATRLTMSFSEPVPRHRVAALMGEAAALPATDQRAAAVLAAARAWAAGSGPLDPDLALSRAALAAARRTGDVALVIGALDASGTALSNAGLLRESHRVSEERLRLAVTAPRHEPAVAAEVVDALHVASTSALAVGDLPGAAAVAAQADRLNPVGTHPALMAPRLIRLHALTGRFDDALARADVLWDGWLHATTAGEASHLSYLLGDWPSTAAALAAMVHGVRGNAAAFDEWRGRARRMAHVDDAVGSRALAAPAAFVDVRVATHTGCGPDLPARVGAALASFPEKWWWPYAHAAGAELAVAAGLPAADRYLDDVAPAATESDWASACLARATARHTGDQRLMAESVTRWERIGARFERAVTLTLVPGRAAEGHAELSSMGAATPVSWPGSVVATDAG